MHQTVTQNDEDGTLGWLEAALEHACSRGQSKALAYLEAVLEDVAFEKKMSAVRASDVG